MSSERKYWDYNDKLAFFENCFLNIFFNLYLSKLCLRKKNWYRHIIIVKKKKKNNTDRLPPTTNLQQYTNTSAAHGSTMFSC